MKLVNGIWYMVYGKRSRGFTLINFLRKTINVRPAGFTLIETLVVIAILAVMGGIITEVFVRTLRANNKSQVTSIIKQNGQATLELMDKAVRNSQNVICPPSGGSTGDFTSNTLVISKINETTNTAEFFRFKYVPPTSTTNGYITEDMPTTFAEANCGDAVTAATNLTDTNAQTGVSINSPNPSGLFIRNVTAGAKDTLSIKFTVGPAIQSPKAVTGQIDPVEFKTIVVLR